MIAFLNSKLLKFSFPDKSGRLFRPNCFRRPFDPSGVHRKFKDHSGESCFARLTCLDLMSLISNSCLWGNARYFWCVYFITWARMTGRWIPPKKRIFIFPNVWRSLMWQQQELIAHLYFGVLSHHHFWSEYLVFFPVLCVLSEPPARKKNIKNQGLWGTTKLKWLNAPTFGKGIPPGCNPSDTYQSFETSCELRISLWNPSIASCSTLWFLHETFCGKQEFADSKYW